MQKILAGTGLIMGCLGALAICHMAKLKNVQGDGSNPMQLCMSLPLQGLLSLALSHTHACTHTHTQKPGARTAPAGPKEETGTGRGPSCSRFSCRPAGTFLKPQNGNQINKRGVSSSPHPHVPLRALRHPTAAKSLTELVNQQGAVECQRWEGWWVRCF